MSAASAAVLTNLTLGLDLAGVAANALLGAVKARERHLDLFGSPWWRSRPASRAA